MLLDPLCGGVLREVAHPEVARLPDHAAVGLLLGAPRRLASGQEPHGRREEGSGSALHTRYNEPQSVINNLARLFYNKGFFMQRSSSLVHFTELELGLKKKNRRRKGRLRRRRRRPRRGQREGAREEKNPGTTEHIFSERNRQFEIQFGVFLAVTV